MKDQGYYMLFLQTALDIFQKSSKINSYAVLPFFAKEIDNAIRFQISAGMNGRAANTIAYPDKLTEASTVVTAIKSTQRQVADMAAQVKSDDAEYFWKEYVKGVFFSKLGYTRAIYHPRHGTTFSLAEPRYAYNSTAEKNMPVDEYIAYRKAQLEGKNKENQLIPERKDYQHTADFNPAFYMFRWDQSRNCYTSSMSDAVISADKKKLIAAGRIYELDFKSRHEEFFFFNPPSGRNIF